MKMKYSTIVIVAVLLLNFVGVLTVKAQSKPNIIFILTDDLGYGDVGVFFQKQRQESGDRSKPYELTPNLDKMAAMGARFTQQYANAPVCAPSRASLITGVNQGNASVRDNQFDKAIENNHTVPTVLKQAGYQTVAIGKWGLQGVKEEGPNWPAHPLKRGFDHYFGYMRHADGHEHYPVEGLYRGKKEVWDDYKEVSAGLNKCYTADLWTAAAKKWIIDHQTGKAAGEPFFMYLAYDTPHAVIELPTQAYPAGNGLKGGLQWLGEPGHMINTANGTIDSYQYPEYANAMYDDDNNPATPEIAWPETFKRYATATRRIDDAVGDIMQLLKDLKIADNTLVVFTSDNGPSIESYLPASYKPNQPTFFGSNGPFDGIKRDCWEGGLRMPTIAEWPGHIDPGKVINTPSMLSDWMPTFADIAHLQSPARADGVSLLPSLTGKGKQQNGLVYVEYFEGGKTPGFKEFEASRRERKRDQMQVIRLDDLVGVRYQVKSSEDDFEIYNAVTDPKETDNLALKPGYESIQVQMKAKVLQVRHADGEAPRPYDNALIPANTITGELKPGINWKFYKGDFPWVISEQNLTANEKGAGSTITGKEAGKKDGVVCYDGYVKVPADGKYTFSLQTTGKAYLRLHEATLIDEDFGYEPNTKITQDVYLKAGYHKIMLNYLRKETEQSDVKLEWKSTDGDWKAVGFDMFY
ncbi:sulfatase-like hydrolase/transferase [Mucilaginibacter sp. FT3.2]|uniref:sulfatase-like hydrolase/transferase n=1 Tax=Mucilaginibacter sp. FT3.2 TaxID=2723090 RepID=UPI001611FF31|nr:sulfatase-like hydrolase/transferase [Mucilaginibacter sp. FT3.2]MBB6231659.1 arylsulfatase A-like enzyme [Mucilaginibacter sp. FT3.2]